MHVEAAAMPAHELFDELVVYFALALQHGQDLGAEDLFELFPVSIGEAIEGPVRSKQPVGDNGMKMGLNPGVIAEGVDHRMPNMPSSPNTPWQTPARSGYRSNCYSASTHCALVEKNLPPS